MNWKFWQRENNTEQRSCTYDNSSTFSIFGVKTNGVNVTQQTAMMHTTVYACVNVKAQGLSSVPLTLYRKTDNGRERASAHPLHRILATQVSPLMTSTTWREMVVQDLELRGTHFSQVVRNRGGQIVALYPLIYDRMKVELDIDKNNIPSLKYEYSIPDNGTRKFKDDEILRIVGLPSSNGILGVTPIAQNKQAIGLGMATEQFGSKFFENGANGSGILSTEKQLNSESTERLRIQFGEKYAGLSNSNKPILLEDGMKWQPLTISNNDSQFLETRQFQKSEIASIFRVSPHLINDLSKATFSNITELSLEHVKYCLLPTATKIENAINTQLLTEREQNEGYYCEFNFSGMMRGDIKSRFEAYQIGINGGFIKPNEARELENFDIDSEVGNKLIVNNSYASLEEVQNKSLDNEQDTTQPNITEETENVE